MTYPQIQFMEKVMSDAIDHIPEIDYLEVAKRNILSSTHYLFTPNKMQSKI